MTTQHSTQQFTELIGQLFIELENYLSEPPAKVMRLNNLKDLQNKLQMNSIAADSKEFLQTVTHFLEYSTNLRNPHYLGHQVAIPNLGSICADLINGVLNNSTAVFDMGASGVVVEQETIKWALDQLGYDSKKSGGIFTHGGSLGNLTALLAARAWKDPNFWQEGLKEKLAILVPATSHYSIKRAAAILGLGANSVFKLPTGNCGKVIISEITPILAKARSRGYIPFVIVANAASTLTGTYDDLISFRKIADQEKLWLHVDGAHGASAIISEKYGHLLKGVNQADSIVWDAHKMLQTSSLCAMVLFKESQNVEKVFNQEASYLSDTEDGVPLGTFPFSLECTKPIIGLKLYLTLILLGQDQLAKDLDHLYDRAREFHAYIKEQPDFDAPILPESNIILFRRKGSNELQKEIYRNILREGEFHISFAEYEGTSYLRLTIMNQASTLTDIENLLQYIRKS